MKNSFIQKRLVKYFHYLQPRENKRLIHLIILINTVSKTVVSLQIKVHEVYVKPLKPRELILSIRESDSEDEESENEEIKDLHISDEEKED